jgi:aminocarboxymuconate-semialdehyde decarboxylase
VGDYVLDGVDYRGTPFMDVGKRLDLCDHLGIELQVLSPNPITYFHHIEADIAAGFCRWHNDELASVVAGHPDRSGASRSSRCRISMHPWPSSGGQ